RTSSTASVTAAGPPSHPATTQQAKAKARKPRAGAEIAHNAFRPHVLAEDRLRTWKSPFAVKRDAHFRRSLPAEVVEKTYAAITASSAGPTQSNYAAGILRFHQFCDTHSISEYARMPASHLLLAAFIANHTGKVGGGTVKSWMSGIKAWHDVNGAPWLRENRWVELARCMANKLGTAFKCAQRGPVTVQHMIALRAALNLSLPFDAAVWAIACACFWGCRRLGELTVPGIDKYDPKLHASRGTSITHIHHSSTTPATAVKLPWTESTREQGATMTTSKTLTMTLTDRDDDLCASKALKKHLRVNANVPADAHLFAFRSANGRCCPMTKDWFLACCSAIWKDAKLLAVFGHSFRIGGSTELLLAGVPCEIVAALGGWTSLAFLLYRCKIEHIVPMNVGKAYDQDKIAEVAQQTYPIGLQKWLAPLSGV
ncbi:DNA breaking-rejoining enzyme, partial [Mycena vulgaris]